MTELTITPKIISDKFQSGDITKTDYLKLAFWLEFGVNYEKLCEDQISLISIDQFCEDWSIEADKEDEIKGLTITREDVLKRVGKLITAKKDDTSILEKSNGKMPQSIQLELF